MKYVYDFTEGREHMKELLGEKGATLSELNYESMQSIL